MDGSGAPTSHRQSRIRLAAAATDAHGGMGITDLLGLHFWFKRIGLNRQLLGGPERVREIAAKLQGLVA